MLLILTSSKDATADYLSDRLGENSLKFLRFDTDLSLGNLELSFQDHSPQLRIAAGLYSPNDFSSVWYRRPEPLVSKIVPDTPEGKCALDEWSEALEGFFAHIPRSRWMNYPAANVLASRKIEQLTTARKLGLAIPDTLVTQNDVRLRSFFDKHNGRIITKPLGRAYIERPEDQVDSLIYTNSVLPHHLDDLSDLVRCPTLFQQAIDKVSDVRITIVDEDIHAFELIAKEPDGKQRCDIRRNNMQDVSYRAIELPQSIERPLRSLVSHYQLRFAAIDMAIATDGNWYFFEVNPNGQWAWLDLCGGAEIYRSFVKSFSANAGMTEAQS